MKLDGTDPRQAGDRQGRMATSAAFFVQGLCFAVVVTRVSVLQSKFHLSNGQLTGHHRAGRRVRAGPDPRDAE